MLILITGLGLLVARGFTAGVLLEPWVTMVLRVVLWILFIGWALLLLDSWRLSRPLGLRQKGRLGLSITALLLIAGIGGVTGLAASALTGVSNVGEVFQGGGDTEKKAGRYNILLLGADAAASREGLRPDSINVASIDAETGRTVLFGLPRNMQRVRFPESSLLRNLYPDGYVCDEGACMLNGLWTLGEEHADLYPEGQRARSRGDEGGGQRDPRHRTQLLRHGRHGRLQEPDRRHGRDPARHRQAHPDRRRQHEDLRVHRTG